jgi:hypothetical protein
MVRSTKVIMQNNVWVSLWVAEYNTCTLHKIIVYMTNSMIYNYNICKLNSFKWSDQQENLKLAIPKQKNLDVKN